MMFKETVTPAALPVRWTVTSAVLAPSATVYAAARRPETIDVPGVIPVQLDITDPESVARAALLSARGNSGVILSQLIRGAAEELVSRPGELVDPVLIGAAIVFIVTPASTVM